MEPSIIERIKGIRLGGGIDDILRQAHEIIPNPTVIHDMEYKLMASVDIDNADPICAEFVAHGRLLQSTLEFLATESFVDAVANSTLCGGVTLLASEKLSYNRIFGQIYDKKNAAVCDLVMVELATPFPDNIDIIIKELCTIVSAELDCDWDFAGRYKAGIIKRLLDGIDDPRHFTGHVANLDSGWKNFYAAVIDSGSMTAEECLTKIQITLEQFNYCVFDGRVVAILGSGSDIWSDPQLLTLTEFLTENGLTAGVSQRFDNLFLLKKYYHQAVGALSKPTAKLKKGESAVIRRYTIR